MIPSAALHTQPGWGPGCLPRHSLCWHSQCRVEQSWCNLHSLGSGCHTKCDSKAAETQHCISGLPDSIWPSSPCRGLCPSPPRPGMDTPRRARGAASSSPPLPVSCIMTQLHRIRGCSSCGDISALPRVPLHRGVAWTPETSSLYNRTALADPLERWPWLSCRVLGAWCYQSGCPCPDLSPWLSIFPSVT